MREAALKKVAESLQPLQDDEAPAFMLADVVDRADVRVADARCGTRFVLKAQQGGGTCRQIGRQALEGDEPPEQLVFSFVDDAGGPLADHFKHSIM
jgi:hypothetical protein